MKLAARISSQKCGVMEFFSHFALLLGSHIVSHVSPSCFCLVVFDSVVKYFLHGVISGSVGEAEQRE